MPFLVYSLLGLSAFKLIVDALGGDLLAMYSVILENIIFALIFGIIIRTSIMQKIAPKEKLLSKIEQLKQQSSKGN